MLMAESSVPGGLVGVDFNSHDRIFTPCALKWMIGRIGQGEMGAVGRNENLFDILQYLAGMDEFSRSKHDDDTTLQTRFDRMDSCAGVPLVVTEENYTSLTAAQHELKRKFGWIPHFARLPFIFGVAATRDKLTIHTMHSEEPTLRTVFSADLSDPGQRWYCVIAAVNIARTIRCFVENGMIIPCPLRFDVWHQRNTKRIRLGLQFVEVEYENSDQYDRMIRFYQVTSAVPNLERFFYGHTSALSPDACRIKLSPVGVSRLPANPPELVKCVKDIFRAVLGLHALRYMHCDIRWPNIVEHFGDWILIDCELTCCAEDDRAVLASRSHTIRPSHVLDVTQPWSYAHDLYQVGLLLQDADTLTKASPTLLKLRTLLLSKKFTVSQVKKLVKELEV
jgi:hypothetical protein